MLDCLDFEYIFQSFIYEVSVRLRGYLRVVFQNIFFFQSVSKTAIVDAMPVR